MRIAFIGAGETAIRTVKALIQEGHEIIMVEKDEKLVNALSEELDCSFLQGDGSEPKILEELSPEETEFLFCLSSSDQDNIIASLVGKSLGFKRVVTSIENTSYLSICMELGLEDTIVPSQTISDYLADMVRGQENLKLSAITRDQARFFFVTAENETTQQDIALPQGSKVICFFRDDTFTLAEADTSFKAGDELVVLATRKAYEKYLEQQEKD